MEQRASAVLLQWMLFEGGTRGLGLCLHLFAIACLGVCEVLWKKTKKCRPGHLNGCMTTRWNVPFQERPGSLRQQGRTCAHTLLCLWRGIALKEIIGLLGPDISKCAICFPSLPSLMLFDTIPIPHPPVAAVLYDKIHPSLILSLSLSLSLSHSLPVCVSLAHVATKEVLICYLSDFATLVHIEVTEQSNCETTAPRSDILVKINMEVHQFLLKSVRDCVDFDFYSLFLFETLLQNTVLRATSQRS